MRYIDEVVVPCVWMYRTDTRRRGILLVLQCIRKYLPKSISAYLPELTRYPRYLVPSGRNFVYLPELMRYPRYLGAIWTNGGTQPMALTLMVKLEDLTDLSSVDRWQAVMLKDLPTPETSFPESYKWNDNDPKKGLALNKAGKNSAVALILKEAQDRRKAIKRKAKEGGGDARKSAKVQLGGPSVEAVAYSAELDGGSDDAQVEEGGGGALVPKCRVQRLYFEKAVRQNGGKKGTWRGVCTVPLGNAPLGGSREVMKHVGDTPGQGYPMWTRTTEKAHGFQYKPQGTGSGDTRAWVWQTGDDESADHYLPGFGAMWLDKDGQLWIPAGQALPEGEVRAPKHCDT